MTNPLAEPARIAFAGAWHMNGRYAATAIEHVAGRVDVIIHLGDFGYTFDAPFMKTVERSLAEHGLPLLFVDGNHECFPTLLRYPIRSNGLRQLTDHIWHLPRGFRWTWAGVRFLACSGAYSVDRPYRIPGASWWRDETISAVDVAKVMAGGPADVLISHDCPVGVVIPGIDDRSTPPPFPPLEIMRANEHRQLLRSAIEAVRPRLIWHGHYHRAYQTVADLGYGPVTAVGLNCDGFDLDENIKVVDLVDIATVVEAGELAA